VLDGVFRSPIPVERRGFMEDSLLEVGGDHHSLDIAAAGKNLSWFWGKTQLIIIVNNMIYSSDW